MLPTPIAYTYEADTHCPQCAEKRFGLHNNLISGTDSEGNEVGVIAPWDEWHCEDSLVMQTLACATCATVLDTFTPLLDLRHAPNSACTGEPIMDGNKCVECEAVLCSCERGYGHDCE